MLVLSLRDRASAALAEMPERISGARGKSNALAAESKRRSSRSSPAACSIRAPARSRVRSSPPSRIRPGHFGEHRHVRRCQYAAIYEFGGTIPPHQIIPDKAGALAFAIDGKQVFATRVNLPAVTMPERSYLRSSLAEMADEIREGLTEAVLHGMNDNMPVMVAEATVTEF